LLNPEYNINPVAGNSLGYTHSLETKEKMSRMALGRKHTEEVKLSMSESPRRGGANNSFYGKTHTLDSLALMKANKNRINPPVPGLEVEITDLETEITTKYSSIRKAVESINSHVRTILRREKTQIEKGVNTPYRNRYIISIKRN
jgi:group I intron endonuclease